MNQSETQQKLTGLIDRELNSLELPQTPSSLYEPVRYTLNLGGKRIRPYLTLTGCGLCGGEPEEALPAAIAIELLHNFTLLHDDIMDAAETRRGEPSVFRKWDSATAILSGDAMYAWAFEQLQYYGESNQYSKKQYAEIINIFLESARTVCEGQAYDLAFEKQQNVTIDEYLTMIKGKTAALISGAIKLGGAVADVDGNCLNRLKQIGAEIGIAFQIQDDLLDAIADPEKFGKKKGGDIMEGKKTYLSILALEKGSKVQQDLILSVLSRDNVSQEDVENITDIYKSLGIFKQTSDTIEKRYKNALHLVSGFEESEYKNELTELINNLNNREY
ncbi:MAG: polyprenyl synthetase family protein [Balneolaceae bacterium]|nr:polyprenyl synthetase family protein [Balneolaceae bacterium]